MAEFGLVSMAIRLISMDVRLGLGPNLVVLKLP